MKDRYLDLRRQLSMAQSDYAIHYRLSEETTEPQVKRAADAAMERDYNRIESIMAAIKDGGFETRLCQDLREELGVTA